jgi:hypothetical protein
MEPIARLRHAEVNRTVSVRRRRVLHNSVWLVTASLLMLAPASRVNAQAQNACPPGFNDTPALLAHLDQADIASGKLSFKQIFRFGQQLFITDFNKCDGAGRPGDTGPVGKPGVGTARTPDPFMGPRFTGLSGPDSNSCASCHNEPEVGGAGSFRANLADGAQDCNPVAGVDLSEDLFGLSPNLRPCHGSTPTPTNSNGFFPTFNERGSLGLFGSGAIELLGREMTDDLLNLQTQAIQQALAMQQNVTITLQTKGVQFGTLTAHPDGSVDTSGVQGVSPDLVIRPMGRTGNHKSIRRFSNQAFNRHLGMQPEEAVQVFSPNSSDPDQDGVSDELTTGDVTALIVFEAALPVPRRAHLKGAAATQAARGEALFAQVACTSCHIPALPLNSTVFCEPNPRNGDGTFGDQSQKFCFDLQKTSGLRGKMVPAYTDLKRHTICDPTKPYDPVTNHYCSDVAIVPGFASTDPTGPGGSIDRPFYYQFLTAKLWDGGNSGPWGHRNDLDTIYDAIVAHGGEAAQSEAAYEALSDADQLAVVAFLKTLKMPIMLNNPQPQEIGSPLAFNPGGGFPLSGDFPQDTEDADHGR